MVRVLDVDIIVGIAVVPVDIISVAVGRNAGINTQTVPVGLDTEDVLGDIDKGPCCSAGQPAVFCFTSNARLPLPMTVSAMEIQGLLWQKIPAFSLYPGG